jgi:uncharacterized protein YdaU (DUF1376 family)
LYYYSFHVGDYSAHTRHLTPMEDLAYRRLLDAYYVKEGPLQGTPAEIARTIALRDHVAEVEAVLREFFEQDDGGSWRHGRCDAEIQKYRAMVDGGRRGAAKRWPGHPQGNGEGNRGGIAPLSPPYSPPNGNHEPRTKNQEPEATQKPRSRAAARPEDVPDAVWSDFASLRRQRRAPVTETVVAGIRREAAAAGMSMEQAIRTCVERGWQSFKADWAQAGGKLAPAKQAAHIPNMPLGHASCACAGCTSFRRARAGA